MPPFVNLYCDFGFGFMFIPDICSPKLRFLFLLDNPNISPNVFVVFLPLPIFISAVPIETLPNGFFVVIIFAFVVTP